MQILGKNFQLYLVIIRPMQTRNALIPGQHSQTPKHPPIEGWDSTPAKKVDDDPQNLRVGCENLITIRSN